jgi:hypothetical protein
MWKQRTNQTAEMNQQIKNLEMLSDIMSKLASYRPISARPDDIKKAVYHLLAERKSQIILLEKGVKK